MSVPPNSAVLDRLLIFADEAAALTLEHWERGVSITHKDAGLGQAPTEADLAIGRLLHAHFGSRLIDKGNRGSA